MNPFYFGSSAKQLFGIHHPPEGGEVRDGAVLICPPFGPEYIAAHRPLQQLAVRLSRAGFHALRVDYFGSGDSAGDLEDATVEQWVEDVRTAAQELADTSGARRISMVGLRLGAALAALAARDGDPELFAAVLWEPVVAGADYVAELQEAQAEWLRRTFPRPDPATLNGPVPEVLGFAFTEALQSGIAAIDLTAAERAPAEHNLVLQNVDGAAPQRLHAHLAALATSEHSMVENEPCWLGHEGGTIALVPVEVNKVIAEWLVGVHR